MPDKLKPCPFCGSEAKYVYDKMWGTGRIGCSDELCFVGFDDDTDVYTSGELAIAAWNTRANETPAPK